MMFKIFTTHLYIVEKHSLLKYLNHLRLFKNQAGRKRTKIKKQKICKEQNQKSFSEYVWEELIYSGKIRTLTHNDLKKYLNKHHYFIEDLKKVRESEAYTTPLFRKD